MLFIWKIFKNLRTAASSAPPSGDALETNPYHFNETLTMQNEKHYRMFV